MKAAEKAGADGSKKFIISDLGTSAERWAQWRETLREILPPRLRPAELTNKLPGRVGDSPVIGAELTPTTRPAPYHAPAMANFSFAQRWRIRFLR